MNTDIYTIIIIIFFSFVALPGGLPKGLLGLPQCRSRSQEIVRAQLWLGLDRQIEKKLMY